MSNSKDSEAFLTPSSSLSSSASSSSSSSRSPKDNVTTCHQRCLYAAVVTSFIITVILVTVIIILIIDKPSHVTLPKDGKVGTVCFGCNYLGPGVESSETLYDIYRRDNNTICCFKGNNDLNNVFYKIILEEQKIINVKGDDTEELHSDVFSRLRRNNTGAHLYLDPRALSDGYLSWTDQDSYNSAYTTGIEFKDNAMHIPQPGHYLVYSHITYTRKYPRTQGGKSFVHYVTRSHPRQPNLGNVNILVSKNSYPQSTARETSFLSAVLRLRTDDEIRVTVSDTDSVCDKSMTSYFGVIKL